VCDILTCMKADVSMPKQNARNQYREIWIRFVFIQSLETVGAAILFVGPSRRVLGKLLSTPARSDWTTASGIRIYAMQMGASIKCTVGDFTGQKPHHQGCGRVSFLGWSSVTATENILLCAAATQKKRYWKCALRTACARSGWLSESMCVTIEGTVQIVWLFMVTSSWKPRPLLRLEQINSDRRVYWYRPVYQILRCVSVKPV
jgi:hypothetical protein